MDEKFLVEDTFRPFRRTIPGRRRCRCFNLCFPLIAVSLRQQHAKPYPTIPYVPLPHPNLPNRPEPYPIPYCLPLSVSPYNYSLSCLPYHTLPALLLPTLLYPTPPHPTLHHPTPPHPTLPTLQPYLPYPTLPYPTLPCSP